MAAIPPSHASLRLARQGRLEFEIRLPRGASAVEEFAADELSRALYAIIGPRSRVGSHGGGARLYLNDLDAAHQAGIDVEALRLGQEMFHLETRGGALYLLGGGPRGLLYGVYDLLDGLGCRWYTPEIQRMPRLPDLALPHLTRTGGPAFENRDTFNSDCSDPLWRVRSRMNGSSVSIPAYMGGNIAYFGFVHTFYDLLPPGMYFDTHPEYYSLVGGQRRRDLAQLCLTNPDVLRIVTARVLERMHANPWATIFSVSQNDCLGACECDACRAVAEEEGSQSGPILRFVNAIAAETCKQFPGKWIDTLAYQYSLEAPRISVPHPNVRVRLCSINCCQGHTYGTCDHPESRRFLAALQGWSRRSDQLYIWHYATDFTHYPLPMPDFDELHGNLNLYKGMGVRGLFIQGMGEPGGWAESMALRGYAVSRLLWQPNQPVWPIVDEFLTAYYGKAAPHVRRYLDIFHQAVREQPDLHPSLYDLPTARLYDDDLRVPAEQALAHAETQVTGAQRERVRMLRGGLRYARLFRAGGPFRRDGNLYSANAAPAGREELEALVSLWKRAGVQRIREAESFDFSIHKLHSRLTPHAVAFLTDARQALALVPDLGGRFIEWQVGDWQWLAPAAGDSTWSLHPFSGGYTESLVLGMYASRGWGEACRVTRLGGRLRLSLDLENGLRITRAVWLENGVLHLRTRLHNRSASPLRCAWGASLNLRPPAGAVLAFSSPSGETRLSCAAPETTALLRTGDQAPRAGWRIETDRGQFQLEMQTGEIERFSLSAGENILHLDWQTAMLPLEPGQHCLIQQTMRVRQ